MEAMRQAQALVQAGRAWWCSRRAHVEGRCHGGIQGRGFPHRLQSRGAVVPVAIDGSYKIMEANHNLMKPAHVNITILPPVETAGLERTAPARAGGTRWRRLLLRQKVRRMAENEARRAPCCAFAAEAARAFARTACAEPVPKAVPRPRAS